MKATVLAGVPATNNALYHRIRFSVMDPAAIIETKDDAGNPASVLIVRDIEMDRARKQARADRIACPAHYKPESGLSGDRETATAQAVAECLLQTGVTEVTADRSMPLIFAQHIQAAGISLDCSLELGVKERRSKDEQELGWIREAQGVTEDAMRMACEMILSAEASSDGTLSMDGEALTSERVRQEIDVLLLKKGYNALPSIVAGGPAGADCHDIGSGPLRTGQPIIIDIFPQNRTSRYSGDCTRTVVHGELPEEIARMHAVVVQAKAAAINAVKPGITGEAVHEAAIEVVKRHDYEIGLPADDAPDSYCGMVHGTGHGVGLDVHEPPLLDTGGPELVVGDVLTIEPGLYSKALGGVRVEDMVVVTADGCENYNTLPEGLQLESLPQSQD